LTIDDELILELIKPDAKGKVTEEALIVDITGTKEILYKLEESTYYLETYGSEENQEIEIVRITPDITIWKKPARGWKTLVKDVMKEMIIGQEEGIAIELENDIQWDFQSSLKQVKKYKGKFQDTRIIIPDDFKRFAPLYRNEGFRVYLWNTERIWNCLKCGTETVKEGPVVPKCQCGAHNHSDFRLVGLKNTKNHRIHIGLLVFQIFKIIFHEAFRDSLECLWLRQETRVTSLLLVFVRKCI
jgi:hypothetical protein